MKQSIELGPHPVICQKWEERKLGWASRPDGFSLHLSMEALRRYIADYWKSMPEEVPDEYSRPDGTPYPVGVAESVLQDMTANEGALRFSNVCQYPGSAGIDGWMPERPHN